MNKSKIKSWTTFRIREVLSENYTRGVNGTDYCDIKDELQYELWERENIQIEIDIEKQIKEREEYENREK